MRKQPNAAFVNPASNLENLVQRTHAGMAGSRLFVLKKVRRIRLVTDGALVETSFKYFAAHTALGAKVSLSLPTLARETSGRCDGRDKIVGFEGFW